MGKSCLHPLGVSCRVASLAAGLGCGGPECSGPLQTSSSRSVERWPRLPLGGRSSCGSTQRPIRERRLAGSPVQTAGLRSGGPFASSHSSSLVIRVVLSGDGLDSPGQSVQLQDAVGHPGSSSSDRRPAAGLRGGGEAGLRGATRSRRMARVAAGMKLVRQVGELTLPGYSAQGEAAAGRVDGPCPAGPHQSELDLKHPPGRVGRGTSVLPAGRGTNALGPGRRSRYGGG
jgi:hypothetical protein